MQAVITHPDGVADGIVSPPAQAEIAVTPETVETVIRPSRQLDALQRLGVYANAYYLRLLDCLREEFPAMTAALGDDAFDGFAFGYLQHYPSTSYTLSDLGARFPQYLAESRPPREEGAEGPDWADFLIDLARLERLYSEVFDGPGIENTSTLQPDELQNIPPQRWGEVRFTPAPCLRLADFRFPVHEFISAVRHNADDVFEPPPQPTFLAVSRRNYRVRRWSLGETQYRLLSELVQGTPLQRALETVLADDEAADEMLAERLHNWFADWTEAGFFLSVRFTAER